MEAKSKFIMMKPFTKLSIMLYFTQSNISVSMI